MGAKSQESELPEPNAGNGTGRRLPANLFFFLCSLSFFFSEMLDGGGV
jgi:hypothetical protein